MASTKVDLMTLPMTEWHAACNRMSLRERQEAQATAAAEAQLAVRVAAYVGTWSIAGDHRKAVDAQNKMVRRVRAILGFTYPESEITF